MATINLVPSGVLDAMQLRENAKTEQEKRDRQHAEERKQRAEKRAELEARTKARVEAIIGEVKEDPRLPAELDKLNNLGNQLIDVRSKIQALAEKKEVTLEDADDDDILAAAKKNVGKLESEKAALAAAEEELERRISVQHEHIAAIREETNKAVRVALHKHVDELTTESQALLIGLHETMKEIRFFEGQIRNPFGGRRHGFWNNRIYSSVEHKVERFEKQVQDVKELSEAY